MVFLSPLGSLGKIRILTGRVWVCYRPSYGATTHCTLRRWRRQGGHPLPLHFSSSDSSASRPKRRNITDSPSGGALSALVTDPTRPHPSLHFPRSLLFILILSCLKLSFYDRWNSTSKVKGMSGSGETQTISSPLPRRKGSSFSSPDECSYDPYGASYSYEVARPYGVDTEIYPMSPTIAGVVKDWENAQIVERSENIYSKRTPPPSSPSTSTLPVYKSEGSTKSTVTPSSIRSQPSFVNDTGLDTARYSTRAEGSSRFSISSIEISDSRPASPSQFSDDFKPLPLLPSFPQPPPPYGAVRPYSASSAAPSATSTSPDTSPFSSLQPPTPSYLRHAASAPEGILGVQVTVDTIRQVG